ncbi:hypothetical protein BS47DRAFT_1391242 [Hydnum rufescens UP504]|uniref:HMA domain-containing protein n=1 Tax=Hydnum rufescens UP504 TaxID=1448309 RepID=A0A9P6B2U3_9AGAM|nr:hypothetical protein BS47DRAFT_1391242 [Hydnum rufescens UP504]
MAKVWKGMDMSLILLGDHQQPIETELKKTCGQRHIAEISGSGWIEVGGAGAPESKVIVVDADRRLYGRATGLFRARPGVHGPVTYTLSSAPMDTIDYAECTAVRHTDRHIPLSQDAQDESTWACIAIICRVLWFCASVIKGSCTNDDSPFLMSLQKCCCGAQCGPKPSIDKSSKSSKVEASECYDIDEIERSGCGQTRPMMMSVQGMDCQACAIRLTKALLTLPSVADLKVSLFSGQATLTYLDGAITPENIARRATILTGFRCEARAFTETTKDKRIAVQVSTTDTLLDAKLPAGVVIRSVQKHESGGAILELEYDAGITQPRDVVSAFASWHAVHIPRSPMDETDEAKKTLMSLLQRTIISVICCIPVLIFSWAPIPPRPIVYGSVSLVFTTIIQLYVAAPLYSSAFRSLFFQRTMDMDLLVVLSTTIAYIFSIIAFAMEAAHHPYLDEFFETPSLLVTLIMGGSLASAYASRRASSAIDSLASLQVRTVDLVDDDGVVAPLSNELIHIGDIVRVLPSATIPTDGFVVSGTSEVDESAITGESMPVEKQKGSKLIAGTLNLSGLLHMSVERLPSDNTVASITSLMREAQDSRLPVQDLSDHIASYFPAAILTLSIITFLAWVLVGFDGDILSLCHPSGRPHGDCDFSRCLCQARDSFKTIQAIQYIEKISVAVFDKTGTLTEGKLRVVRSHILRDDATQLVLGLTSNSHHPVANGVTAHLLAMSIPNDCDYTFTEFKDIQSIVGKGLEAMHANLPLRGGNPKWLGAEEDHTVHELLEEGLTPFVVMHGEEIIAAFGLADIIRQGSQETIDLIRGGGAEVYIVSGDEQTVVNDVATRLGVPPDHAFGNCSPQTKQEHIKRLQTETRRGGGSSKVAFLGDGTNDSLALVQADIGISFGSGTDVALNAADVIILDPSNMARSIQTVRHISRGAVLRIKANFVWSFIYNLVAVLFAGGAFVHARISPQYAGLGELVSVMPVIFIAWTLWLLRV